MYKCDKCNKTFKQKSDYDRHKQRKNPCDIEGRIIKKCSDDEIKNDTTTTNNKDEIIKIMAKQIEVMAGEMKILRDEMKDLKGSQLSGSTINANSAVTNNMVNGDVVNGNVVKDNVEINCQFNLLVGFGKEDLTTLTNEQKKEILNQGLKGPLRYAEIVHCDTYKNIYVSNKKSSDVTVYNGNKWELRGKEYIDRVRDSGIEFMEEQFEELKDDLPKYIVSKMTKFTNHMESDNSENIKKNMSKDIRILFYNSRPDVDKKPK